MNILKQKFLSIKNFTFQFEANSQKGWKGQGFGHVDIHQDNDSIITYERGKWKNTHHKEFLFTNAYRWTLNPSESSMTLEHIRFGIEQPVYLFDFYPVEVNEWETRQAHQCQLDSYTAKLTIEATYLKIEWQITGAHKNEKMIYWYR